MSSFYRHPSTEPTIRNIPVDANRALHDFEFAVRALAKAEDVLDQMTALQPGVSEETMRIMRGSAKEALAVRDIAAQKLLGFIEDKTEKPAPHLRLV